MTPVLSDDQMKEAVGKYKAMLAENGAKLIHEENWGLRKLAYPIQKKTTGFYHLLEYQAEGELVAKLEVAFKRDERVIRYMTVSLDKHAIAYNLKRRNKASEPAQPKAEVTNEA
jgi:small subunit ribosomal protein S6